MPEKTNIPQEEQPVKENRRILIISSCQDCPNFRFDDEEIRCRWGKSWCDKLDRELEVVTIPDDCPLPKP